MYASARIVVIRSPFRLAMKSGVRMLDEMVGEKVVVDFTSEYVCMGTLSRFDDNFIELKNADLHDLRDTDTSRENYIAASHSTGIKRNRKRVVICRRDVVAISRMDDLVDD